MLLRNFYDEKLAHASWLAGCQATGDAIVVDPGRDISAYLRVAEAENLRIVAVAETHIHADYVSGARELADRVGAKLYVSDEGPAEWKYTYLGPYSHQLLKDGDSWMIGNLRFSALHTPGHTPEHLSFLLTDTAGASEPMGLFTGDFLFVGDVGRPDLLEEAAGIAGTSEPGARDLFQSLKKLDSLPDYLQIWPAHGAGSACGKSLGAVPSSTLGYERRFNWAFDIDDEDAFVRAVLAGQPEPPNYFAVMKRVNKEGPAVLGTLPIPPRGDAAVLKQRLEAGAWVVDTRSATEFAHAHVKGSVGIPFNKSFNTYAGWVLPYDAPLFLISDPENLHDAVADLVRVGLDSIAGWFAPSVVQGVARLDPAAVESMQQTTPETLQLLRENEDTVVIDVRVDHEFEAGHVDGAKNVPLTRLLERLDEVPADGRTVVMCQGGGRSFVAASLLLKHGRANVMNLEGGYNGWVAEQRAGAQLTSESAPQAVIA